MRVVFIGTSAGTPTADSGTSGVFMQLHGTKMLFDCGEGSQKRMMEFGASINIDSIFLTHLDSDHVLGVPGLIRTLELNNRERPLQINVSEPIADRVRTLVAGVHGWPDFHVEIRSFDTGDTVQEFNGFSIESFKTNHDNSSHGFVVQEDEREGELKVERLQNEYNLPPSEKYSKLKQGEKVESPSGQTINPEDVVGEKRPGRKVVYTGDTQKSSTVAKASENAHLLIHESTFSNADQEKAEKTSHSTALEAGEVAETAGVDELVLTHISPRYGGSREELAKEASKEFGGEVKTAEDGMEIRVSY